jgi:hypothetical protein
VVYRDAVCSNPDTDGAQFNLYRHTSAPPPPPPRAASRAVRDRGAPRGPRRSGSLLGEQRAVHGCHGRHGGAVRVECSLPHSLKAPRVQTAVGSTREKNWFQSLLSHSNSDHCAAVHPNDASVLEASRGCLLASALDIEKATEALELELAGLDIPLFVVCFDNVCFGSCQNTVRLMTDDV